MVENFIKTELPQSTLDLIKSDKQQGLSDSQNSFTNKRYEFQIILKNTQSGYSEKMHIVTKSYEDLRLWIIGLNALIGNKKDLMRLSSMIKS